MSKGEFHHTTQRGLGVPVRLIDSGRAVVEVMAPYTGECCMGTLMGSGPPGCPHKPHPFPSRQLLARLVVDEMEMGEACVDSLALQVTAVTTCLDWRHVTA